MLSLIKLLNFFLSWFIWFVLLIIMSIVIPIQMLLTIFCTFMYFFIFTLKLINVKIFKSKKTTLIYSKKPPLKNFFFIFFYFFFWDLPKKKAFFYFYSLLKFIFLTKNKLSLLKVFRDYKTFCYFLKSFLIIVLVKFITTFSLISIKNTNYVFMKTKIVWLENWSTLDDFFSNLVLNLIVDYNYSYSHVLDYKILIDQKIIFNPFTNKNIDIGRIYFNILKEKNLISAGSEDLVNQTLTHVVRYGTSDPIIAARLRLNDDYSINTLLINKDNVSLNFYNNYKEYLIKGGYAFSKINQHNIWNIAGYNESRGFYNYLKDKNIELPSCSEKLKALLNQDPIEMVRIKAHLVINNSCKIVSAKNFIWNYDYYSHLKIQLSKDLILYWNEPILKYSLIENNNLIFNKTKQTLGEFLLKEKHTFASSDLKFSIDCVSNFFEKNSDIFNNLSKIEIKEVLQYVTIKNNIITTSLFKGTSLFEKQSQNVKEVIDKLNINKNSELNQIIDLNEYIDNVISSINS